MTRIRGLHADDADIYADVIELISALSATSA